MAVNSLLFGPFLVFSVFTIKCFIYGIMPSHFTAFFAKLFDKKKTKKKKQKKKTFIWFARNRTSSDAYFWADSGMEIESLLY